MHLILEEANELKLLQGLQVYATLGGSAPRSPSALRREDLGALVSGYLASRGRRFTDEVRRKQARQLGVTVFLEEVS